MSDQVEIVGAFIFPHGTITLDPETRDFSGTPALLPTSKEECIKLHSGMKLAAEKLVALKPDIVILSTPHGLTLQNEYLFIANTKAQGSAEWEGQWTDFKAEINLESPELTKKLVAHLRNNGSPVEALALGAPKDPVNLRWGEVVPWWFISEASRKVNVDPPKAIIFGQARKRLGIKRKEEIPTLLQLGANLSTFLREEPSLKGKRVAIAISSDLSHYNSKDPTSPYASDYTEGSTVFDQYIQNWAAIDYVQDLASWEKMEKNLIKNGGDLADSIGSCGFTGLVFLHGFMKDHLTKTDGNLSYKANIYHYSAPTYYGMLCSAWTPQE